MTAVEVVTATGSRWFGTERVWIGPDQEMHLLVNPNDETRAAWPTAGGRPILLDPLPDDDREGLAAVLAGTLAGPLDCSSPARAHCPKYGAPDLELEPEDDSSPAKNSARPGPGRGSAFGGCRNRLALR
jgi:hypothetical protein